MDPLRRFLRDFSETHDIEPEKRLLSGLAWSAASFTLTCLAGKAMLAGGTPGTQVAMAGAAAYGFMVGLSRFAGQSKSACVLWSLVPAAGLMAMGIFHRNERGLGGALFITLAVASVPFVLAGCGAALGAAGIVRDIRADRARRAG